MKELLVIVGPTGTGKTDLGIYLAKKFNSEIVSADSRQLYKGMDIGTGKATQNPKIKIQKSEGRWVIGEIPIHLYDVITPDKTFSVAQFQQLAYQVIGQIRKRNKLPILVGGSGLYVQAVTEGLKIPKAAPDKNLRKHLEAQPLKNLVKKLEEVDPETAEKIDKQNSRRIIRALEIYFQVGQSASQLKGKYKTDFETLKIGLNTDRKSLYDRIDMRVDSWFEVGFVEEVKDLLKKGYRGALGLNTLGYRQVTMYLEGSISLPEAKKRIKFEHHNLVRRQVTWFRRDKSIHWLNINQPGLEETSEKLVLDWLRR